MLVYKNAGVTHLSLCENDYLISAIHIDRIKQRLLITAVINSLL